jgi:hypothetical protein
MSTATVLPSNQTPSYDQTSPGVGITAGYNTELADALIDSGAVVSTIDAGLVKKIHACIKPLSPEDQNAITQADGSPLLLVGWIEAAIVIAGASYANWFYVRPDSDTTEEFNLVIGIDLLDKSVNLLLILRVARCTCATKTQIPNTCSTGSPTTPILS